MAESIKNNDDQMGHHALVLNSTDGLALLLEKMPNGGDHRHCNTLAEGVTSDSWFVHAHIAATV